MALLNDTVFLNTSDNSSCDLAPLSHSPLVHISAGVWLLSYLLPTTLLWARLCHHTGLVTAQLLLVILTSGLSCGSEMIWWHCGAVLINILQIITILYQLRENKFEPDIEDIYTKQFNPFKVSRSEFSSLLSSSLAKVSSLHPGECYAVAGISRTDSLGLLLSGRCSVLTEAAFLHNIEAGQFLDSPEFDRGSGSDKTLFKVTICAAVPSKMIVWQRKELEYLFAKKPKLGIVVGALISRDVSTKIYAMTNRMKRKTGLNLDIRLPPYMSRMIVEKGDIPSSYKCALLTRVRDSRVTLTRDKSRRTMTRGDRDIQVVDDK